VKKRFALLAALAVLLALAGCRDGADSEAGTTTKRVARLPLFEYIGEDAMAFAEHFEDDFPVSVTVRYETVAGGEPYETESRETIRAVFEALRNMTVVSDNGSGHTDDYLTYTFAMIDGRRHVFTFQTGCYLGDRGHLLGVEGFGALQAALSAPSGATE
jgi:hypothetical protein